jgi:uncharacterized membrane protein
VTTGGDGEFMDDDKSSQDRLDQLIERVNYLESILREQTSRLYALELRLGVSRRPPDIEQQPLMARKPDAKTERRAEHGTVPPLQQTPPVPIQQAPPPLTDRPPSPVYPAATTKARRDSNAHGDLESRIGGSWFNRIGIIAISIGVAFFLKYAFENEWIGPAGRVTIGIVIGFGFLIAGERLRVRYPSYAHGLSGGGIFILYLSVFAAAVYYELISRPMAFAFMAGVTAIASLLAVRYNALPIAILGLIGGFLTPVLMSTNQNNQVALFGYIALLDAGVLALAYSKQWRSLNYLAFSGTVLMFAGWMYTWDAREALWTTMFFLTLFFAIFALLAVLYNVVNRRQTSWLDLALVFLNAVIYFGTSYALLEKQYDAYLGVFAVLVSAFYLGLGYFTYNRDREDQLLIYTFIGLATLFLVLAVPIQLEQRWVTMGWAIEGAILTGIGLRVNDRTSRYAALIVFAIAALEWLLVDTFNFAVRPNQAFTPLLNRRALSCATLVAALAIAAWFYKLYGEKVEQKERAMFGGLYVLGANALTVTLLSLDANDYFEQMKSSLPAQPGTAGASSEPDLPGRVANSQQFTLSALWTVYGATALFVGVTRKLRPLRLAALALLTLATLKVLAVDLGYYTAPWHTLVFNQTFAAFALLILALASGVWLYARAEGIEGDEREETIRVLMIAANLLAVIALSAEAYGYFAKQKGGVEAVYNLRDIRLAQQLSLSLVWIVYGGAMLIVGISRRRRLLRFMALGLLGLAIIKVFLLDLSELESIYRIISFIALGAILLVVSFLYQRYRQRAAQFDDEEEIEAPVSSD